MTELPARRLLLVHAHPDDESINNGVTMARYAAEGALVTLVTCTLGERGEVIPPELRHLTGQALGTHRRQELDAAMAELGVTDVRLLGGAGRYRDSGMMGLPDNEDPDCLWQAGLDEAAEHLVAVVREVRPQVLVTYDDNGGYGHPDHIKAHRVAMRAVQLAADPAVRPDLGAPWQIARVFWNRVPRSVAEAAFAQLRADLPDLPFDTSAEVDDVPGVVPDERITARIEGDARTAAAKAAAMRAHATQIEVAGSCFALSNELAQPLFTTEYYELVRDGDGSAAGTGTLTDLFAGLEEAS
ncbi:MULTISPECIES: N-acetyl-1-D-myo-inositol-2-amino-2-deoxy-alpha-D-glucopyranoside deacetylase [Streptomyces]|uniref:N-acetyl-1-D-myo-inositol-2-amino-2-deoxy-alpha- D-glucopyranoside deacetylase n=1 Tax=Streptomyces TaxID=1883 RepID=UPI000F749624|nr:MULTISPECIES: N-acetyl-1-D-myo-inositol-2-amino-2-deoxy-alpha-D-glucopyranoside deacetylase [Streptomyces]RSS07695.1 N-acetyl-1-D-myo-inositol-2-amino-2-deoxy-alpha-D-glucopyranoside deacetylase [Streptomyces sp. WAC00469]WTD47584.1 N-acetyl-1-D-myo-inositol-2-amino-2-deoxy-alpha-D-glucopyranoside deacetylase [Streptomyces thermoviolaceus]GGV75265.1 1D-myo-inositol 2-acetamido-2-deoxy-alpha-D-glucopyranoside deacetylase [Streptomyces thermoviolaceus subsp. apingens]